MSRSANLQGGMLASFWQNSPAHSAPSTADSSGSSSQIVTQLYDCCNYQKLSETVIQSVEVGSRPV